MVRLEVYFESRLQPGQLGILIVRDIIVGEMRNQWIFKTYDLSKNDIRCTTVLQTPTISLADFGSAMGFRYMQLVIYGLRIVQRARHCKA